MQFNMDESIGFILNRTAIASKTSFNTLIKSYGVSAEQWSVIYRVVQNKGISQKELADSTYKDQGNLTRMLDKLVQKEYIVRELDQNDRRAVKLFPTKKSEELAKNIVPNSSLHNEKLLDGIKDEDKVKLFELLNKVYTNITKE